MKDNLTLLTGPADKSRGQLEELKRNFGVILEYWQIDAQIKRTRYKALIDQGFNEAQALELCK